MSGRHSIIVALAALAVGRLALPGAAAGAPSLEARLDRERALRALVEGDDDAALADYIAAHPVDDAVERARYEIALARRTARRTVDPVERLRRIEDVLTRRADLIASGTGDRRRAPRLDTRADPRLGIWLADQASDLYFDLLPVGASGLTTLFGVPSEVERRRAERVAREMPTLAASAEREIDRAILAIESAPGYREDAGLQLHRRRLAEEERDRRIPFFRGIGEVLAVGVAPGTSPGGAGAASDQERLDLAVRALTPLTDSLPEELAVTARLYCGLALAWRGNDDDDRDEIEATRQLDRVIAVAADHPLDAFAARLGLVVADVRHGRTGAAVARLDLIRDRDRDGGSLFARVLVADLRFRVNRAEAVRAGVAGGAGGAAAWRRAVAAYDDLLSAETPPGLGMRNLVLDRLADALGDDAPDTDLPALAGIALARRRIDDPATRADAIASLDAILARRDATPMESAMALDVSARALYDAGRLPEAGTRFMTLARDHPTDPTAERAIEIAASIAHGLYRDHPGDAAHRRALREAVDVLLDRYPNLPTIDRWRYVAGRVAMSAGAHSDAIASFDAVAPDGATWLDARFMRVAAIRFLARSQESAAERMRIAQDSLDAAQRAREQIGAAIGAEGQRAGDLRYYLARLKVYEADARLDLADPQGALQGLAGIERDPDLDGAGLAEALRIRIDAYKALDRMDEAGPDVERFLDSAPDEAQAVLSALLGSLLADAEARLDTDGETAVRRYAERELLPIADLVIPWLDERGGVVESPDGEGIESPDGEGRTLARRTADACRYGGRYTDALRLYDRLLADHPAAVELLIGRADCLLGLGERHDADAMRIYRRIAAAGPGTAQHEPDRPADQTPPPGAAGPRRHVVPARVHGAGAEARVTRSARPTSRPVRRSDPTGTEAVGRLGSCDIARAHGGVGRPRAGGRCS